MRAFWDAASDLLDLAWEDVPSTSLRLSESGGAPEQSTAVHVCHTASALLVRFDCRDRDIWSTYERRDDPVWKEEAVEVFVSLGDEDPREYFELEVSPAGVLFDALVSNPTSRREDLVADTRWDCPGIRWGARIVTGEPRWVAALAIPWSGIGARGAPRTCRANFYRIERPRDGEAEYSAWSPTLARPADFHKPSSFGRLVLSPEEIA